MGIQINGQTDTITAVDGSLTVSGASLPTVTNLNATGIVTATGFVVSAGSTSVPSISPSGDSNTGIFFPSSDTVCIGEGGSEVIRVNSDGRVGINSSAPTAPLTLYDGGYKFTVSGGNAATGMQIGNYDSTINSYGVFSLRGSSVRIDTGGSERVVVSAGGSVSIGVLYPSTTPINRQLILQPKDDDGIRMYRPGDSSGQAHLDIVTTTTGSAFPTGEAYTVKYRTFNCDQIFETYASGGTGGNISFKTQTSSSSTTERVRIDPSGRVRMFSQPFAIIAFNANDQGTTGSKINSGGTVIPTRILENASSIYNSSNGRYTAPITGLYEITFSGNLNVNTASGHVNPQAFINGTLYKHFYSDKLASSWQLASGTTYATLSANDYVEFRITTSSGTIGFDSDDQGKYTHFIIRLVH